MFRSVGRSCSGGGSSDNDDIDDDDWSIFKVYVILYVLHDMCRVISETLLL